MNFRENFINDLRCNLVIKGKSTFKELASLYDYPEDNGENLCKKDYYKFLRSCHDLTAQPAIVKGSVDNNRDNSKATPDLSKYNLTTFKIDKEGKVCDQWYKTPVEVQEPVDYKALFKEAVEGVKYPMKASSYLNTKAAQNNLLVINATDVHLNKKYVTNPASLDEQIATFKEAIYYSLEEANNYDKVLFVIGHDFLHSEFNNMTTKGTPQDCLESFEVLFKKAFKALIEVILLCGAEQSVDVVMCNGNHAYAAELQLFSALEVYFEHLNNDNIKLFGGKESRKYYSYYNNSFMLIHDTKNKVSQLPLLFAAEKPLLFTKKNKYILSGHLHSKQEVSFISSAEGFGIEAIQCPSLSGTDRWHDDNMYTGNRPRLLSLVVHPEKGIINHIIYNKY
jgi:hypothetical protein